MAVFSRWSAPTAAGAFIGSAPAAATFCALRHGSKRSLYKNKKARTRCGLFACFLFEVAVEQTLKGFAVAGLVAGHFVHGVVDRVVAQLLGALGQLELALGGAPLGVRPQGD